MIDILKKYKYSIILLLLAFAAVSLVFQHNIGLIIDCGREAYYPQEVLNGKVLYRDLFNIYAPFSYLFNAFLYKIFGINLKVLCIAGSFCAVGIIIGIFLLIKILLNEKLAFYISLLAISVGIIPVYVFNYVFPYSFGITYGLLSFIFSLLFLICFVNSKSNIFLYISLFFAGLSICCKYEFLPYLLIYLPIFFKLKLRFNVLFKSFLCFGLVPEICLTFLYTQGLRGHDIVDSVKIVIAMSHTQTLKYFYIHSGVFPHKESVLALIITFLAIFIPFFVYMVPILFKNKIKNPALGIIFTYLGICLALLFKNGLAFDVFMSLPIILFIITCLNYKKLISNINIFIVVLSIILVSLKVFWGLVLNSYGIYYLPLIIFAICLIFKDKLTEKEWDHVGFYILILSVLLCFNNLKMFSKQNTLISTPKGKMYVEKKYEKTKDLLEYIEKNTKKTDKIVIYPEGMMINFLSDRKTDDFYNSFLPLYEETFGIGSFREYFEKNMPEYIIFNSWNSSDYYFSIICKDYGFDFCEFVEKNYKEKIKLPGDFSYIIYQKK